jgi:probable addiction module antidote protein
VIVKDFSETLAPRLRNKEFLAEFLAGCLAVDLPTFFLALRDAVQAHDGGFTWLANVTGRDRAGLYQALSVNGNPSFKTVYVILKALEVDRLDLAEHEEIDRSHREVLEDTKEPDCGYPGAVRIAATA